MPIDVGEAEKEIFGEKSAFSKDWTRKHGIPDKVKPSPASGLTREFSPADTFSQILETGLTTQPQWYEVTTAIDSADSINNPPPGATWKKGGVNLSEDERNDIQRKDQNFKIAAMSGFIRLLNIHGAMKSSRIDTVANSLKEGPTPQGIAQWLLVDDETRHALGVMFKLAGYSVGSEPQLDEKGNPLQSVPEDVEIYAPPGTPVFSDHMRLRHDQIDGYLKEIQEKLHVDWGIVRVAYTIFRILGFPHENVKFSGDLVKKYEYRKNNPSGDIDPRDIAPFIDRLKDPKTDETLKDILARDGVVGLALALNAQQAEKVAREWADMGLMLDAMDKLGDIRKGVGGSSSLAPEKRLQAIEGIQELQLALAKRKFRDETAKRIFDPKKIESAPPAGQPSFMDRTLYGMRVPLSGLRSKPPSVKGDKEKK